MSGRLLRGWVQVLAVLIGLAAAMLLAGFLSQSTRYPTSSTPASATDDAPGSDDDSAAHSVPDRVAVLTFDGAPDQSTTGQILDTLHTAAVPATFFVTGSQAMQQPKLLQSMAAAGHEIGNGTFTYRDLSAAPAWRETAELRSTQAAIVAATGRVSSLVRPYGPSAASAGTSLAAGTGPLAGYVVVPTGSTPTDWGDPGPWAVVTSATPVDGEGVIVSLPADSEHAASTLEALPAVISMLRDRGYSFATVSSAFGEQPQASMTPASSWQRIGSTLLSWSMRGSATVVDVLGWLLLPLGILTVLRALAVTGIAVFQARRSRRPTRHPAYRGGVSIIVPAYNEGANIAATLTSLLATDYPSFEIIVVDDGSTDRTPEIVDTFADRVVVVHTVNGGKASALNIGLTRAGNEIVVMVDGDTVFEPTTLAALVADLGDPQVGAVAGNTKVVNRRGFLGRWQHVEYVVGMNLDRRMFQLLDCMPTVPGAVGAFRREALLAVGGVPTRTLAEDTDLTMAMNLDGWKVTYASSAIAWTEAPSTLTSLARQRYRWSYGTMQAMWFHRRSMRPVTGKAIGHVGSRGIPYLFMFQVLQPLLAPIIDLYVLYSLLFLDPWSAIAIWLVFNLLQVASTAVALRMDGEKLRDLWVVPTMQVVYRQMLYAVVLQSVASAISGTVLRWHAQHRTGAAAEHVLGAEPATT